MNKFNTHHKVLIKFLFHIIFWIGVYLFYTYFLGYGSNNPKYVNRFSAFLMPVTMAISYVAIYYLIPKYLLSKKYTLFILYSASTVFISVYAIVSSVLFGLAYTSDLKTDNISPITKTLPFIVLGVYLVVLVVVSLNLVMHNYTSTIKNDELKNRILETQLKLKEQELNYLKSQIQPHFLFNTLNTLYGFAINKANETPEMILKLSNLLDYLLYQTDKPFVLLSDEINHIKDYIQLEKMRFNETLDVSFDISGKISDDIEIAPMLFIPFVENSFKHGKIVNGKLTIHIDLNVNEDTINFSVKNSVNDSSKNNSKQGIGLKNIEKRLTLMYKGNYTLTIKNNTDWYKSNLSLNYKERTNNE